MIKSKLIRNRLIWTVIFIPVIIPLLIVGIAWIIATMPIAIFELLFTGCSNTTGWNPPYDAISWISERLDFSESFDIINYGNRPV